jgi:hypothetical protein
VASLVVVEVLLFGKIIVQITQIVQAVQVVQVTLVIVQVVIIEIKKK